jgi:hypothetical protein
VPKEQPSGTKTITFLMDWSGVVWVVVEKAGSARDETVITATSIATITILCLFSIKFFPTSVDLESQDPSQIKSRLKSEL